MPISAVLIRFRLLVPLPHEHTARDGRKCRLFITEQSAAFSDRLMLHIEGQRGDWLLHETAHKKLPQALFEQGFEYPISNRRVKLFLAMCREGHAEIVEGEHCAFMPRRARPR